jgi:membrane protein implicated in regulation of membrane protease activity
VEVSYTLAMDDTVAYTTYLMRKHGVGRALFLFCWLVIPLLSVGGAVWLLQLDEEWAVLAAVILALSGVIYTAIYPSLYRSTLQRRIRALTEKMGTRGLVGRRTLLFSEESLTEINEVGRSEVKWQDMERVEEVDETVYLFVTESAAWILPRRGFDSDADYDAARSFIFRKLAGKHAI